MLTIEAIAPSKAQKVLQIPAQEVETQAQNNGKGDCYKCHKPGYFARVYVAYKVLFLYSVQNVRASH